MSERKRKRHSHERNESPTKRVAVRSSKDAVRISLLEDEPLWKPILASAPGLCLSNASSFKPYRKSDSSSNDLLLHSEAHPALDYVAHTNPSSPSSENLKHYIGIYNPHATSLKIVPASHMTVRTTLKTKRRLPTRNTSNSDSDSEPLPPSDRRALAEAFGTKKARKRLQDQTENAISPSKSIRPNQPLDPLASAVLSTMPTSNPSRAKTAEEAASSKSIPKPNLSASSPSEAYPISTLVGNTDNLSNIRIQSLLDSVAASASVQINSHFLGPLLVKAAQARDIRACRLLKYTLLLIELYKIIITPPPGRPAKPHAPKRLPRLDTNVMKPLLEAYTGPLVDATAIRFTENAAGCGGNVTKWHLDLLVTHILALSLHVATPPFVVDTWLLQKDLVMDAPTIGTMFKELGCEVKAMGKSEMEGRKLSRAEGGLRRLVKLKVPLTFPGVKIGGGRRGMGR